MLKDKKGNWVETIEVTEDLWKTTIKETRNGVLKLLEDARKLLNCGGNEAICAGLYTYAIEEYGKLLLLKQYHPSAGIVKIKYKTGFRNHTEKFRIAVKSLPAECTTLKRGIFDTGIFDAKVFDTEKVVADFEARMAVFYSDFLDSGDGIKAVPQVDKELLGKGIEKLRTITLGT
jgi:AbiV family abortive infection protein